MLDLHENFDAPQIPQRQPSPAAYLNLQCPRLPKCFDSWTIQGFILSFIHIPGYIIRNACLGITITAGFRDKTSKNIL